MADFMQRIDPFNEIRDIVIADGALTIAFAIIFTGGFGNLESHGGLSSFLYYIPIAFVAVSLSFILHEYMHKIVAQRFGAAAAFRKWDTGIIITLASSLFGFLIGLPGATMIYTNRFTVEEEGWVSLAGPLTNFAVFLTILIVSIAASGYIIHDLYLVQMIDVTLFISVWLAFFNMLPIYPLDGSKVLRWHKTIYFATIAIIFVFLYLALPLVGSSFAAFVPTLIILLAISLIMSYMYRGLMRF